MQTNNSQIYGTPEAAMLAVLDARLPELGLSLTPEMKQTLCRFAAAMLEQNRVMNLTAITDPEQVAALHLLDSLTVLQCADFREKAVIDVGCGAGFPGVPIAIACPRARVTLLDSLGKRMNWLGSVLPRLGIRAECVTARAEEEAFRRREAYDIAVSRAVARLNILLELTAPFVKPGGMLLAMKGDHAAEELQQAERAVKKLGLELLENRCFPIENTAHTVLVFRKVSSTPPGYPRRFAKIKQNPL